MKVSVLGRALALSLLAHGCVGGGESILLDCEVGTVPDGSVCVPDGSGGSGETPDTKAPKTTASPPGADGVCPTKAVAHVVLTSNEPATIHYTIDGSEPTTASPGGINQVTVPMTEGKLRFFSIDAAGNVEAPQTETYAIDADAPGLPKDVAAQLKGGDVDFTWTNPGDADLGGVLVLSSLGSDEHPENCATYHVGDAIGGSTVEFIGAGSAATFKARLGMAKYRLYAFDKAGNFGPASEPVTVTHLADAGAQSGALSVANPTTANPTVTVTQQPNGLVLAATATGENGALTIDVTVSNGGFGFAWLAPKVLLDGATEGTASKTDGVHLGKPFWRPVNKIAGIDIGGSTTFSLRLSGVTGAIDPLEVDLSLVHSAVYLTPGRASLSLTDTDTLQVIPGMLFTGYPAGTNPAQNTEPAQFAISPDNRRVIYGSRKRAFLYEQSLTDGAILRSVSVPATGLDEKASVVAGLVADAKLARIYLALSHRCRNSARAGGGVELVALDAGSLQVVDRVEVEPLGALSRADGIHLSPTGARIAVTTSYPKGDSNVPLRVHVFDTATLAPVDLNPADPERTSFNVTTATGTTKNSRGAAFLDDTTLVVAPRHDAPFYLLDFKNDPTLLALNGYQANRVGFMTRGPDGRVWATVHRGDCNTQQGLVAVGKNGLVHYGGSGSGGPGSQWYPATTCPQSVGIAFHPDGKRFFVASRSGQAERGMLKFELANPGKNATVIPVPNAAGRFDNRSHAAIVSPF